MKNELIVARNNQIQGCFGSLESISEYQKISEQLSGSTFIPDSFRGKPADVLIALDMAMRLSMNLFAVLQNIYIVPKSGKPSWSGQFFIACINKCGRFTPLDYEYKTADDGSLDSCRVKVFERRSGSKLFGPWVSISMAKSEGWMDRNPKWRNMPEVMLRYRAAAFFARTVCPDVTMGFSGTDDYYEEGVIDYTAEKEKKEITEEFKDFARMIQAAKNLEELKKIGNEISGSELDIDEKDIIRDFYSSRLEDLKVEMQKGD